MSDRLDELIDPLSLAAKGRTLEGRIPLAKLARLGPSLQSTQGEAEASLRFGVDEAGMPNVTGRVRATLMLQCQRCMQAMAYAVDSQIRLGIVKSREAAERLPANYDPLLVSGEEMKAADIVEDELILALPIVAMHERADCPLGAEFQEQEADAEPKRENPFAVLAGLKKS
jgi:uncharacterized protein